MLGDELISMSESTDDLIIRLKKYKFAAGTTPISVWPLKSLHFISFLLHSKKKKKKKLKSMGKKNLEKLKIV